MKKISNIPMQWLLRSEKLKTYTFKGWLRFIKLKLLDKNIIIRGNCKQCGACCQRLSIDIDGTWLRSTAKFKKLSHENPAYQRFKIIGRDLSGYLIFKCQWLNEDGRCKDYKNRLPFCKHYPEQELYFTGGEFNLGCGFAFEEVLNFETLLKDQ